MEARPAVTDRMGGARWRLTALLPILLLVGAVSLVVAGGTPLLDLVGKRAPQLDEFDVRRVEFRPGEIRIRVSNPQHGKLEIGVVTVDDAIVPFRLDGPRAVPRLRASTIVVPYDWTEGDPLTVGVTSSSGIETTKEIAAAVETPRASARSFLGYAIIGFLVGLVPIALGLLWLPSLRRTAPRWLAAFMALTAGLLTFLALDALSEALQLQAALPNALGGAGLVLLGVASSYLVLTFLSQRSANRQSGSGQTVLGGLALATLVAVGIGLHNMGEGLAIGSSLALGELSLGTFLIVGFMVHNVTEGLAIAAPIAQDGRVGMGRLSVLAAIAGAPAIAGAWIGGFVTSDFLGVLFFSAAAGAALEVVAEVVRYLRRSIPNGVGSSYVLGGFLAGIVVMYATGLLAA
jgi:zinc transporter ZupT